MGWEFEHFRNAVYSQYRRRVPEVRFMWKQRQAMMGNWGDTSVHGWLSLQTHNGTALLNMPSGSWVTHCWSADGYVVCGRLSTDHIEGSLG